MAQHDVESFVRKSVNFVLGCAALAISLQGCGTSESCPDLVPIANGKVKMECKKGDTPSCEDKEVRCESGYGYGVLAQDQSAQMRFTIKQPDNCVIKFTKEPPYCHACLDNNKIDIDGGSVKVAADTKPEAFLNDENSFIVTCDNGKTGARLLNSPHSIQAARDSLCIFELTSPVCVGDTTQEETAKINTHQQAVQSSKAVPPSTAVQPTSFAKIEQNVSGNFNAAEQTVVARGTAATIAYHHPHKPAAPEDEPVHDEELLDLGHIRPWVLTAHAAAHRERT